MTASDPNGRPGPEFSSSERHNLEYLKGMARAPMGWPAVPPTETAINPAELQQMLDRKTNTVPSLKKPWYAQPKTYIALLLFAALIAIIVWLV